MPLLRLQFSRLAAYGLAIALGLAAVAESASVLIGRNFHVLVPGRVYRSAQPSPYDLHRDLIQYGIKTVINLRGTCPCFDWYRAESQATADCDMAQEDITFSAGRLPDPRELRRLVEVLDHAEYPVLIHCRRGVDRTGLTAVLIEMLYEGTTRAEARTQLGYRFGHFPWGRTAAMLRFFDLYDGWLARTDKPHCPKVFRQFLLEGYCPGPARGTIELIEPVQLTAGVAGVIRLRATNTSDFDWHLRPGTGTGIHLKYWLRDEAGVEVQLGQAGLFAATIPPGGHADLTLPINRLPHPGIYALQADLLDGPETSFAQLGGDIFTTEFTAR